MDVADLDGDKRPEIALRRQDQGPERRDLRSSRPEARTSRAASIPFRWGQDEAVDRRRGSAARPPALRVLDVNRDGQPDVLVFNALGLADRSCSAGQRDQPPSPRRQPRPAGGGHARRAEPDGPGRARP